MTHYAEFKCSDQSGIALEVFQTMEPVGEHCHDFLEFVLITKGSCIHRFKDLAMPLIPGDIFLIPPHQQHAYSIDTPVCMYNCQFYPDKISALQVGQLGGLIQELTGSIATEPISPADLNRQHIIHLSVEEAESVRQMLEVILQEQTDQRIAFEQVKQDYLNLILVVISRARENQFARLSNWSRPRRDIVTEAQAYIDRHLTETIDFASYARLHKISAGHFRALFKAATGLPPVEYLNRLRIVRAIEFLKDEALAMSDVSAAVGIYDANYFSRLFRKIIGYSPREFRNRTLKMTG